MLDIISNWVTRNIKIVNLLSESKVLLSMRITVIRTQKDINTYMPDLMIYGK